MLETIVSNCSCELFYYTTCCIIVVMTHGVTHGIQLEMMVRNIRCHRYYTSVYTVNVVRSVLSTDNVPSVVSVVYDYCYW